MFQNLAHRGASHYCPENTFSAFYQSIVIGATGIETDVRLTKDNHLVLFHDETVDRVTNQKGKLREYSYKELLDLPILHTQDGNCLVKKDTIVLLEDFLKYIKNQDITLAIELKECDIEKRVLELLYRYDLIQRTVVTSFDFSCLKEMRALDESIKLGFLAREYSAGLLNTLKEISCTQFCPNILWLDENIVLALRNSGFSIRAWGVKTEELMKKAYGLHIDGMTVNFPDKLSKLMNE